MKLMSKVSPQIAIKFFKILIYFRSKLRKACHQVKDPLDEI